METREKRKFGMLTVLSLVIAAAAIGAAISWWAFGAPRGVDLAADSGSTADWIAAIGTAVVGLGAMWFAYESHGLRLREVTKEEERDLNLEAGRLLATCYRLEIARHPGKVFEEMSVSNGRVDCRFVQASLTTSLNTLNGLGWKEDEIAALPPECIPTMVALQISIKAYLDFGPRLLQKCQSNVTLAVSTPEYEAVANASAQLRIESSEVIDALLARIDGIRDLLLELQAAH